MDIKIRYFILVLAFFIFLSVPVFAQQIDTGVQDALAFVFGEDVRNFATDYSQVLQLLLFPFLTVIVVVFGVLETLDFFRGHTNIHITLSVLIAFMAARSGWFLGAVQWLYGGIGQFTTLGFGVLLAVAILIYFIGKGHESAAGLRAQIKRDIKKEQAVNAEQAKLNNIEAELDRLNQLYASAKPGARGLLEAQIKKKEKEKEDQHGRVAHAEEDLAHV